MSPLEKLMGDLGAAAYEARSAYQFARGNGPLATWTPVTVDTEQGRLISVEENVVVPATGQPLPAGSREHVQGLAQAAQNEVAEAGERLNAGDMAGARVLADSAGKKSAQAVAAGVEEARKAGFHIPEADTATEADPDTGPPAGGKTLHRIASDLKEALLELGLFGLGGWAGFKSLSMAGAELGFETWLRVNFAAMSLIVVPPQPSTHDQI